MTTLFLDRDGVLNVRTPGDYVKSPDELVCAPGAPEALAILRPHFDLILTVTNQAGIGKGKMSESDLADVHEKLLGFLSAQGGRIDRIYFCPHRPDMNCNCRKPLPGMGFQAQADFPELDFSQAWMVGDSASDIEFGRALGMKTALIAGKTEEAHLHDLLQPDLYCDSLLDFARQFVFRC